MTDHETAGKVLDLMQALRESLEADRAVTPVWFGTVYVDPELGRPCPHYAWNDPELRLKTPVEVTGRVL